MAETNKPINSEEMGNARDFKAGAPGETQEIRPVLDLLGTDFNTVLANYGINNPDEETRKKLVEGFRKYLSNVVGFDVGALEIDKESVQKTTAAITEQMNLETLRKDSEQYLRQLAALIDDEEQYLDAAKYFPIDSSVARQIWSNKGNNG